MSRNVINQLEQRLSPESLALIQKAGALAAERRLGIYLVGGVVRDILLGRANSDLDLVVEGDAIKLAESLAGELGGRLVVHRRFGTAKIRTRNLTIDLAMARAETYARPGALPTVRPGSIQDDLARRDFTVNAMALRLDPDSFGKLVDPFDGQKDLENKLIRVLHDRSFIDDATRMLRAVRYEQRFGFRLEASTEKLLRQNVAMLRTISGDRIRHELELILKEERPEKALTGPESWACWSKSIRPSKGDGWLEKMFEKAREAASPPSAGAVFRPVDLSLQLAGMRGLHSPPEDAGHRLAGNPGHRSPAGTDAVAGCPGPAAQRRLRIAPGVFPDVHSGLRHRCGLSPGSRAAEPVPDAVAPRPDATGRRGSQATGRSVRASTGPDAESPARGQAGW